jgi:ornithine decarboxylase
MARFSNVVGIVASLRPDVPVHCLRPHAIDTAAKWFMQNFPGEVMYSVKSNPDPVVLRRLYTSGIKHFDVASLYEVELVGSLFKDVDMHYMHPVKSRESIYKAYFEHGIKNFSLDSCSELKKIMEVTQQADDLGLFVRIAIPNAHAAHDLSGKFGVNEKDAVKLLRQTRKVARSLGVCFHVGSQCMHPTAYSSALLLVKDILDKAKVMVDSVDVGGGFPSVYPGLTPPPLDEYMETIREYITMLPYLNPSCKLWCEPGRSLVAEGGSVIVRVELRKGNTLYINDGVYGSMFDAGFPGLIYPARALRPGGKLSRELAPFSLFGPTCDSLDAMKGPFYLPSNVREGDYIEIGQLGAYGATLRTRFNGFFSDTVVEVEDAPLMSMYGLANKPVEQADTQPSKEEKVVKVVA